MYDKKVFFHSMIIFYTISIYGNNTIVKKLGKTFSAFLCKTFSSRNCIIIIIIHFKCVLIIIKTFFSNVLTSFPMIRTLWRVSASVNKLTKNDQISFFANLTKIPKTKRLFNKYWLIIKVQNDRYNNFYFKNIQIFKKIFFFYFFPFLFQAAGHFRYHAIVAISFWINFVAAGGRVSNIFL